jgi:hypothetical protein
MNQSSKSKFFKRLIGFGAKSSSTLTLFKSNWGFIFLLMAWANLQGQEVQVRGTVMDSIAPLGFANVIATYPESGNLAGYSITNNEGRYALSLSVGETYVLRASFLGYETQEKELFLDQSGDLTLDFYLKAEASQLDGVEIVYEMPVTVKGDTIVYNADSFNTGNEKKLGDVLENLPGVEVNDDGEIQVEGKTVQKVMVEGKDFFDGDSKLATKNIPANAIDKVEVLRNFSEVGQMRGVSNNQDNVAINIKLKEGKKNFWFGEVTAGSGVDADIDPRYLVHPKLFYYHPEYSINLITDLNDIGEVPFTWRDYFNFTGGFRNFNSSGGTQFNIRESDLGFAIAQNNRAAAIGTKFAAANFSYGLSPSLDLSGFGIASENSTSIISNTINQFILSGITEQTQVRSEQNNQLGMLKFSGIYKPDASLQVDYDLLLKASDQRQEDLTFSAFADQTNDIAERKENRPASLQQNINAYYTASDNDIFAGQLQHMLQTEDPFYNAVTDLLPFAGILPVSQQQGRFDLSQTKEIQTDKIDGKVDYYRILNKTSHLNLTLGATLSTQEFDSRIFEGLAGNSILLEETLPVDGQSTSLINQVKYNFNDVFLGVHYKIKRGDFTFSPGLTLHQYALSNTQQGSTERQDQLLLLPDFFALWDIKNSENLRFNYSKTAEYTDVNNLAQAYVFNNYNRLFAGNRYLGNALSESFRLNYFSYNLFNYTNINGSLSYTKRTKGIKNNTTLVAINQVTQPENFDPDNPDHIYTASGRISKRISKIEYRLNATVSYSELFSRVNEALQESQSLTQNYRLSARSSFQDWPNFEVGYNWTRNQYNNGRVDQLFFTQRPFFSLDVNFWKSFYWTMNWDFYDYRNEQNTVQNNYSFLNSTLYFQQQDSQWEFSLQGTNLTNNQATNTDSFTEQFNSTSQYVVLPRIIMFVIKYDL